MRPPVAKTSVLAPPPPDAHPLYVSFLLLMRSGTQLDSPHSNLALREGRSAQSEKNALSANHHESSTLSRGGPEQETCRRARDRISPMRGFALPLARCLSPARRTPKGPSTRTPCWSTTRRRRGRPRRYLHGWHPPPPPRRLRRPLRRPSRRRHFSRAASRCNRTTSLLRPVIPTAANWVKLPSSPALGKGNMAIFALLPCFVFNACVQLSGSLSLGLSVQCFNDRNLSWEACIRMRMKWLRYGIFLLEGLLRSSLYGRAHAWSRSGCAAGHRALAPHHHRQPCLAGRVWSARCFSRVVCTLRGYTPTHLPNATRGMVVFHARMLTST